jgi:hypothetical protein
MPRGIRSRLTFSNVVSLMALFVALSGGAYALTIPTNSVGTRQLKKDAVTTSKIKANAVRSSDVLNGSLLAADFKLGQLPAGAKGDPGAAGQAGQKGDPGTAGAPGADGVSGYETATAFTALDSNTSMGMNAMCPTVGKRVIGGGANIVDDTNGGVPGPVALTWSNPNQFGPTQGAWFAQAREMADYAGTWRVRVYVICANVAA